MLAGELVEVGAQDVTGGVDQLAAVVAFRGMRWTWVRIVHRVDIRAGQMIGQKRATVSGRWNGCQSAWVAIWRVF